MNTPNPILRVSGLSVAFADSPDTPRVVDELGFELYPGEILGLVGESGCGKSMTALALMGLIPPPGRILEGSIQLGGQELIGLKPAQINRIRGRDLAMIFQDPMTALNPVFTVGNQLMSVIRRRRGAGKSQARELALELMRRVDIPAAENRLHNYPHELSGGLRQRIMIAMALACQPQVLIADEPTTALDVTTQAQILTQLAQIAKTTGTAMILITHDLGIVAETCHRAIVMYCGRMVEYATVNKLFKQPRHPYTAGLLSAVPRIRAQRLDELPTIPGRVPNQSSRPSGCSFHPRCPAAEQVCRDLQPAFESAAAYHFYACHHPLASE